ncbi:hypothetical protein SBA4_7210001 [Candidatus Sulfopaludibacter sp. SbA4]|nr:hypothetical protein SBA4_7210001 [Candidatus Sulfopaludibacter sp. SbA4]
MRGKQFFSLPLPYIPSIGWGPEKLEGDLALGWTGVGEPDLKSQGGRRAVGFGSGDSGWNQGEISSRGLGGIRVPGFRQRDHSNKPKPRRPPVFRGHVTEQIGQFGKNNRGQGPEDRGLGVRGWGLGEGGSLRSRLFWREREHAAARERRGNRPRKAMVCPARFPNLLNYVVPPTSAVRPNMRY